MTTENITEKPLNENTPSISPEVDLENKKAQLEKLRNMVMKSRVTGFCTLNKAHKLMSSRPKDFSMLRIEDNLYLLRTNKKSRKAKKILQISDPEMAIIMSDVEENTKRLGL